VYVTSSRSINASRLAYTLLNRAKLGQNDSMHAAQKLFCPPHEMKRNY